MSQREGKREKKTNYKPANLEVKFGPFHTEILREKCKYITTTSVREYKLNSAKTIEQTFSEST